MNASSPAVWPPTAEQLAWRPAPYSFGSAVSLATLTRAGRVPAWLDVPADVDDPYDWEVPSATLAGVLMDTRPGNTDSFWVEAVRDRDGRLRIVVWDEYETAFAPPDRAYDEPLTLGELLEVIDETVWFEDPDFVGFGHALRERNLMPGDPRSDLADVVYMESERYPMLPALDRARELAWLAGDV